MNPNSMVFSHQSEIALELAELFDSVTVFTSESNASLRPKNVRVVEVPWRRGSYFGNAVRIIKSILPFLIKNRHSVVFTHMTDIHAALISPFTWLLKMHHVLWYAHAHNSPYLIWASFFVNRIASSTPGSCNLMINKNKLRFINQGVSAKHFPFSLREKYSITKMLNYGRLDPSKNVNRLIELTELLNGNDNSFKLDIYGATMSSSSLSYLQFCKTSAEELIRRRIVNFLDPIERRNLPKQTSHYGLFLNLFIGSLDKTLVEATLMGLPVVTWNQEYCREFGTWSKGHASESISFIIDEINALQHISDDEYVREVYRRHELAKQNHSLDSWIIRLLAILNREN
jgi:glycosyltransferase involved in cell wall biosynthesis